MRRVDQAELFEVGHDVTDRRRRQRHRDQARNVARADRFAGRQIAFDDLTKNIPRTLIELGEPGIRRDQADRFMVGHWHSLQHDTICPPGTRVTSAGWANQPVKTLPPVFRAPKSTASDSLSSNYRKDT